MGKVVLIDFSAEWCGPCKMQDPIIEKLEGKFKDTVEFRKIDVDSNIDLSSKYGIHAVPTIVIEKDGEIYKKYVGVTRPNVLEKDLNEALK
ncbi:MAG: thioredoxin fold domain-containing protein [Methanosarcinales archaeon]|nr:thioredoxin fold domain-containing protein [Methanosarcinales archaeon]